MPVGSGAHANSAGHSESKESNIEDAKVTRLSGDVDIKSSLDVSEFRDNIIQAPKIKDFIDRDIKSNLNDTKPNVDTLVKR